jgi:tRNA/rRNA methyltransferase
MLKMATHKAAHLIREMDYHTDTRQAVAPYHILVGTTTRQGKNRIKQRNPKQIFSEIAPLLPSHKIGLLFGPESTGLSNYDLDFCSFRSTILTADFSSLNLAQAIAIHCYELFGSVADQANIEPVENEFANSYELEGMYDHIEKVLMEITFLKDKKHTYWMRNIRQFLGRVQIKKKEASIIRGICRKFLWFKENRKTL